MQARLLLIRTSLMVSELPIVLFSLPGTAKAQDVPASFNIVVFRDKDSLTVCVPNNALISLWGVQFEVTDSQANHFAHSLDEYPQFAGLGFDAIQAPICLRLVRQGATPVLPGDCQQLPRNSILVAEVNDNDFDGFLYDNVNNQGVLLIITRSVAPNICPPQESRCPIFVLPVSQPTVAPGTEVTTNDQWTPITTTFDRVEMVEVPPGSFTMGNANGFDEKPANRQCFNSPFWIDKTDVTLGQFKCVGGVVSHSLDYVGDNRPMVNIAWYEARDFCEKQRDEHLPTEAEWEYAVRGPNDLAYPWSNTFERANVVWSRSSGQGPADVGTIQAGTSWVSALYRPYPYRADDGRESGTDPSSPRSVRGRSWGSTNPIALRTTTRGWNPASVENGFDGFRCVRSF